MNLAIVTDNQDPDKLGRVRAQFPHWGENIGRSLPSGQQMLAKSKGSGSASSGTGKGGAVNRKVIEQSSDMLTDSLMNEYRMRSN